MQVKCVVVYKNCMKKPQNKTKIEIKKQGYDMRI